MSQDPQGRPSHHTPLSNDAIHYMNLVTQYEERTLRLLEEVANLPYPNQRDLAIARTQLETAFMRFRRAIAKPSRISLPEDGKDL